MTDQIPADKVQKIAAEMRAAMRRVEDDYPDGEFLMDMSGYIRDLDKLCARARPRPRLEWPSTQAAPGHLAVGTVIESAADPRLAALPVGSILCDLDGDDMEKTATGEWRDVEGITIESPGCGPWTVHRIGNGADQ